MRKMHYYPEKKHTARRRKRTALSIVLALSITAAIAAGCGQADTETSSVEESVTQTSNTTTVSTLTTDSTSEDTTSAEESADVSTSEDGTAVASGALAGEVFFSDRDLEQEADLTDAVTYTVSDGEDITITEEGVYVLTGTASEVTVTVEAADDAKVQIVLDGVSITNTDSPAIYVKTADKVFVTTVDGTTNTLSVTGTFTADGDTNTDAVIFSKSDLTLNGTGTLVIDSTQNGITSKDEMTITGGTYEITASKNALEANDSIAICDGTFTLNSGEDAIQCENDEDDTVGLIYISGGSFTIDAGEDGIQSITVLQIDGGTFDITAGEALESTYVQINDGTFDISASDDGINATQKSTAYSVLLEINGGDITIAMGSGDTDGLDSNGDLTITGGTIDITGQSGLDYDGTGTLSGGTVTVNGQQLTELTQSMSGGKGGFGTSQGGRMH